jgi:hypothetical protein
MYRLYVDEHGTDDVSSVEGDNERYLSLTGVAMKVETARDVLTPAFDKIKADIFDDDPDEPIIFHRKKIVKGNGPFGILDKKAGLRSAFDERVFETKSNTDYTVITALIDKKAMLKKSNWINKQPYHYLMEVLIEKYVLFLARMDNIGDIMPEARLGKSDERLQAAYLQVRGSGSAYVSSAQMREKIPSSHLKFRLKKDNIAGLQLADLLAHPSHMIVREKMGHDVALGNYCKEVKALLIKTKYDRSPWNGKVVGYGMKWLP